MTSINSLTESLTELARGGIGVAQHVANINNLAHELLGQGGIFDYPLMTGIGKSLYMATMDPDMDISENKLKLFSPMSTPSAPCSRTKSKATADRLDSPC